MMATLTVPSINIGDVVAVNQHGVNFLATDASETTLVNDSNVVYEVADFLKAGMRGTVTTTRQESGDLAPEYAVRFDDDPVDERAWWMCGDEIETVKEEA